MKYCKDCKHIWIPSVYVSDQARCEAVIRTVEDVVDGITKFLEPCIESRAVDGACGPDAKLFEEKTS